ncbi:FAD-dependent monooxygenase [Salinibacterium sp. SYSU T00001]|uniref:FAD-dependent oxidoreductase n=1 Tax=Homoserinimonas sedimenticola TaxID=2986805 RepID=UPI002235C6EA|nr:NAD(P)/FAD-dependent oxidoreductase [Salinibacterium sedimenticola]MCW4385138.1 FAD-dependent monooxygenase [Salinibacterium sedimenticola]
MHDVAVVGGGPVGVLLAVLLAQRGVDAVVIEERDCIAERPRAVGIHPPAVEALAEAGVDVAAHGRALHDGAAFADGRELGRLRLDGVYTLAQQQVERMLRAQLATLRPGGLVLGERVHGLRRVPGGRELLLESGRRGPTARLIVGADGIGSSIRELAGIGSVARRGTAHYIMADVAGDGLGDSALLSFERAGVVESFPLPGAGRRWVALVPRPRPAASVAELAAIVAARTGLHMPTDATTASSFTARQHLSRRVVGEGANADIVLLGDAAHEISPIGGQGLNLGWLDARALAEVLTGDRDLGRYNAERMRAASRASAQAAFNMGMGRPLPGPAHAARSLTIRALARPPFAPRLADAFTMRTL